MGSLQRAQIAIQTSVRVLSLVAAIALLGLGCRARSGGILPAEFIIEGRVCSGENLAVSNRESGNDTACRSAVRDATVSILLGDSSEPSLATRTDAKGSFLLAFSTRNGDPLVFQAEAEGHAGLSFPIKDVSDLRDFAVGPGRFWILVELQSYSAIEGAGAER